MGVSKVVLNGNVLVDLTGVTVEATNLVSPNTAIGADGEDVTGSLQAKTSSDLTVSGATVTAPAGVYSTDASASVASGSATTPATTITANPSISVSSSGLITASNSKTQSVTPTVSAGYVSSGTAGTITVSGSKTQQLTTQAAQTIYPSTSDQTIASGKYLTGTQTIKGVLLTNLTADNIKKDVVVKVGDSADDDRITSVTGTYEGSGGGGITPSSKVVTDLTGTIWYMNETIDLSTWPFSDKRNIGIQTGALTSNFGKGTTPYGDVCYVPPFYFYWRISKYAGSTQGLQGYRMVADVSNASWYITGEYPIVRGPRNQPARTWVDGEGARIWMFCSADNGVVNVSDHTNASFISLMYANGHLFFPTV